MRGRRVLVQVVAALAVVVATVTSPVAGSAQASPPSGTVPRSVPSVSTGDPVWSPPVTAIPDRGQPSDVSCPTTTWCMAVDLSGRAMTYNGTAWTAPKVVFPRVDGQNPGVRAVSCPTTAFCLAVSAHGYGIYRSGTWTVVPTTLAPFRAVGCYSPTRCAVVAGTDQSARRIGYWNGSTITGVVTAPWASRVDAVACPSASVCHGIGVASTGAAIALRSSGSQWVASYLNQTSVDSTFDLACTSTSFCFATSGTSYRTWRWNGTSWRYAGEAQAGMLLTVNSLSCTSTTSCHAVGDQRVGRWNGSSWTVRSLASIYGAQYAVDCPSSSTCVVVDNRGHYWRGGGSTWTAARTFDLTSQWVADLSCPTTTFCLATDYLGSAVRWNGSTWTGTVRLGSYPSSVDCLSPTWCMTVDQQQGTSRLWTGAWAPAVTFDTVNPWSDVACASTTACFVFQSGDVRRWNGRTWSAPSTLFATSSISESTCAGPRFCMAMTWDGDYRTWNGSTWSSLRHSGLHSPARLTCASSTLCMDDSDSGRYYSTFNGTTWSVRRTLPDHLDTLSCPSTTRCLGTSYDGSVHVWNGSSWSRSSSTLPFQAIRLDCVSTWCMAAGYETSSWTL